VQDMKMDYHKK